MGFFDRLFGKKPAIPAPSERGESVSPSGSVRRSMNPA